MKNTNVIFTSLIIVSMAFMENCTVATTTPATATSSTSSTSSTPVVSGGGGGGGVICGNGIIETGEACDDGNLISGDGCSATCTLDLSQDMKNSVTGFIWQFASNNYSVIANQEAITACKNPYTPVFHAFFTIAANAVTPPHCTAGQLQAPRVYPFAASGVWNITGLFYADISSNLRDGGANTQTYATSLTTSDMISISDTFVLNGIYTYKPAGKPIITITAVGVTGTVSTTNIFSTGTVTLTGGTINGISANGVIANY